MATNHGGATHVELRRARESAARRVTNLMRCALALSLLCLISGGLGLLAGAGWASSALTLGITVFVALIAGGAAFEVAEQRQHRSSGGDGVGERVSLRSSN